MSDRAPDAMPTHMVRRFVEHAEDDVLDWERTVNRHREALERSEAALASAQEYRDKCVQWLKARTTCWCGAERGPRTPADPDGSGCLDDINHEREVKP